MRNFSRKKVKGGKLTERFLGPYTIINVMSHGVYEIRNEEGKTSHATGSHLKMYLSSDACCMEYEDSSSSQGDCVHVGYILVCEYHTIKRYLSVCS